jgi:hypothetical protein
MSILRPRLSLTALALVLLASCAGNDTAVLQRLDPETGVTIKRASAPIVMYRDMSANSAFGRDYVYVGPIQVNNMGQREYFLWLGIWGSSDSVEPGRKMDDFETVVLYADGEPLSLEVRGWTPGSIGASGDVYVKPVASAIDGYYRVTIDQMRLIAESRDLELRAGSTKPQRYVPWDSAKGSSEALVAFLRELDW